MENTQAGRRQRVNIPIQRLHNQHITRPRSGSPAELVAAFGAVQAQEYPFAKWAVALRLRGNVTDADIEAACDRGDILRTHVLRPTWHFVAGRDIGWIQQLTAPRVHARLATYVRNFGLEKRTLTKATSIIEGALGGRCYLTRQELRARIARAGIALNGTPLALVIMYAELERVVCSGPRRGHQFTYALVGERAPKPRILERDEALAELARRYFASHGPATVRDFVWWSSLLTADARRSLDIVKAHRFEQDGLAYWSTRSAQSTAPRDTHMRLLPIYDEFLVAYRDRIAVPPGPSTFSMGAMKHALAIDGQIAGTWTTDRTGAVCVTPTRRLSSSERKGVEAEVRRFGRFLGATLRAEFGR